MTPNPTPSAKATSSPLYPQIIAELNANADQLQKRQNLLSNIESDLSKRFGRPNKVISYICRFGHARTHMSSADIPSIDSVLKSVSGVEQINLILHSPGGDATVVEKMVDMCRSHLSGEQRSFRVIVPNIAKSAATQLALGADKIIMGYCSELGPIDPQVQISISGVIQWVSAFAFVESRDKLMEKIANAAKNNEPTIGLLQQLAGLNIPYTQEMENWIEFARKTASDLLDKYMLQIKIPDAATRKQAADDIAEKLLSKQLFPVHGQFIDGNTAQKLGLEVEVLPKDDQLWDLIWEYYVRSEIQMNLQMQPPLIKTKLFESSTQSLVAQDAAN